MGDVFKTGAAMAMVVIGVYAGIKACQGVEWLINKKAKNSDSPIADALQATADHLAGTPA
jgi:hypothetical protein